MKIIGLDTSVVLRLLIGTPEGQAQLAMRFLKELHSKEQKAAISDLVVAETYFALNYHYQVPKSEAKSQLLNLLQSGFVFPEPNGVATEALQESGGGNVDLLDRLIRRQYLKFAEEVSTFDSHFSRLPRMHLLK